MNKNTPFYCLGIIFFLIAGTLFAQQDEFVIPLEVNQKVDDVMVAIAEEGLAMTPSVVERVVQESAADFDPSQYPFVAAAIVDRIPAEAYWVAFAAVNLDPDNGPAIVRAMAIVRPEMAQAIISGARFASPVQIHAMIVAMNDVLPPEQQIPMDNESFFTLKVPEPEQINPTETGSPGGLTLTEPTAAPTAAPTGSPSPPPPATVSPSRIRP